MTNCLPVPIFVISLPIFAERYNYIRKHVLERVGPDFEVVGVYGAEAASGLIANFDLTAGQRGCALSHLAVYELMIEKDLQYAFVLEDDVILPDNIASILDGILPHMALGDVVQIYNSKSEPIECSAVESVPIQGGLMCYPMSAWCLGTAAAYIIGLSAAKGIVAANRPVAVTADNWEYFFSKNAFETARIVHPSPVRLKAFETTVVPREYKSALVGGVMRLVRGTVLRPILWARRTYLIHERGGGVSIVQEASALPLSKSAAADMGRAAR